MIMSVYLWHITALIALIGIVMLLGGIGLSIEPGTALWWSHRPIWIFGMALVLIPFLLLFLRFENASRVAGTRLPGPTQAVIGALVTCAGLVMIALKGIGADNALSVNLVALTLVVVGVSSATIGTLERRKS